MIFTALKRCLPACMLVLTAAASAQTVSRVYITTSSGINVYNVSSAGKLTLVSGSPFKGTSGLAIGTAGNHFITIGTNYIHSYAMGTSGSVGKQVSQINSALYEGGECGPTYGGAIDHTGSDVYVQLQGAEIDGDEGVCDGLQTYKIDPSSGVLTYNGATEFYADRYEGIVSNLMIAGNNGHAYTLVPEYYGCDNEFRGFYRDRFGIMNSATFNETPPPTPSTGGWVPRLLASDNQNAQTSHMAVYMVQDFYEPCGGFGPPVLTSYTIDYSGNIANNGALLYPSVNPSSMSINPQGNLLAVAGNKSSDYTNVLAGLQVFHFNGAKPITKFSSILTTASIDAVGWDKSNHLFAISKASGKLYVYTITSSSIVQVSGSPYTLKSPSTLFVKPLI